MVTYTKLNFTKCIHVFVIACRSQHEEIDLVSEEEFYTSAPESISKPVSLYCVYLHKLLSLHMYVHLNVNTYVRMCMYVQYQKHSQCLQCHPASK